MSASPDYTIGWSSHTRHLGCCHRVVSFLVKLISALAKGTPKHGFNFTTINNNSLKYNLGMLHGSLLESVMDEANI